jgi:hypothetical protein
MLVHPRMVAYTRFYIFCYDHRLALLFLIPGKSITHGTGRSHFHLGFSGLGIFEFARALEGHITGDEVTVVFGFDVEVYLNIDEVDCDMKISGRSAKLLGEAGCLLDLAHSESHIAAVKNIAFMRGAGESPKPQRRPHQGRQGYHIMYRRPELKHLRTQTPKHYFRFSCCTFSTNASAYLSRAILAAALYCSRVVSITKGFIGMAKALFVIFVESWLMAV